MADFSYRLNRRLIVIPVILYGRRGHLKSEFILDTGASSTIVDHSLASALGYSARDGVGLSKVSSVVGKEKGYRLIIEGLETLGKKMDHFRRGLSRLNKFYLSFIPPNRNSLRKCL